MSKVTFSGIKPSGELHIGNYLGAVRHWASGQGDGVSIFCIVDLHAITVEQEPEKLRAGTLDAAAILVAAGVDPKKSIIFVQSHNPDHANLAWIMNCNSSMGQMSRMTQYKEKSEGKSAVSVGLFDYPALMAADILLYGTTHVPVGEDQKQHVELTRDIAQRFNSRYGDTFVLPEPKISSAGARIKSLSDPSKKMSKSEDDPKGTVSILDEPDAIHKKIGAAVTDSDNKIVYSNEKPGVSNLIDIYSQFKGVGVKEVEQEFEGKGYGEFKKAVADVVYSVLKPLQEKYKEVREEESLREILEEGERRAREISEHKLAEVYKKIGFVL